LQYAANKDNIKKLKEVRDTAFVPTSSGQPDVDMVEIGVSSLELEDKESIINQIPISKFNKNSIQMMEGKLAKAPQAVLTDEQIL